MKFLIFAYVILIFGINSSYGNSKDEFILKNGEKYTVEIDNIKEWGIQYNNKTVLYKVLSKIKTQKKDIVNSIKTLFPNIPIHIDSDSLFVLDFASIDIPRIKQKEYKYFNKVSFQSSTIVNQIKLVELTYIYEPIQIAPILLQVGYCFSWNNKVNDLRSFSIPYKRLNSYNIVGFQIGIGGSFKILGVSFLTSINYADRYGTLFFQNKENYSTEYKYTDNNVFFISEFRKEIFKNFLYLSSSVRYYLSTFKEVNQSEKLIFSAGIGFHLYQ